MEDPFSLLFLLTWEDSYLPVSHVILYTLYSALPVCVCPKALLLLIIPFAPAGMCCVTVAGKQIREKKVSSVVTILRDELSAVMLIFPSDTACPVPPVS